MTLSRPTVWLALAVCAIGCGSNPSQPSEGGATGVSSSVTASVTAPRPVSPAAGALIKNSDQPVTLIVANAVVTQSAPATYAFEVASDAAFANKVFSRDGVEAGAAGQTSLRIDTLSAGADYYWRARAEGGGTIGPFSAARKMTVGPAIFISAPAPASPVSGAISSNWPTLVVSNASRFGPAGALVYRFDVSMSADFAAIAISGTVPEGNTQTTFTPPAAQAPQTQTTFYWRVTAVDQSNGVSSTASAVRSFTFAPTAAGLIAAQEGLTLWTGVQPPGTAGHAVLGGGWDIQSRVSFNGVAFQSPTLDELRTFDLLDRGFDPNGAIAWLKGNGYTTDAAYYAGPQVIGFPYQYMAYINGRWDLVFRVGA